MPRKPGTYYDRNKDKISERNKQKYREKCEALDGKEFKKARREAQNNKSPEYKLWIAARRRHQLKGIPFEIDVEDIIIPDLCPILKIPVRPSKKSVSANSPSLDRKKPELGYVKGNVWVISHKANSMKNNASIETLRNFSEWVQSLGDGEL
jgi:hypothetical protein